MVPSVLLPPAQGSDQEQGGVTQGTHRYRFTLGGFLQSGSAVHNVGVNKVGEALQLMINVRV